MEESLRIRRAIPEDAPEIIKVLRDSIKKICSKDYSEAQVRVTSDKNFNISSWQQSIERDFFWVIESKDQLKGYCHLALMSTNSAEILGFYLRPEVLGQGWGEQLLKKALDVVKRHNISQLEILSTPTARKFYEKKGFRSIENGHIDMQGVPVPFIKMDLLLDSPD